MKLIDALGIIQRSKQSAAEVFHVALACGFTPLHLQTFLHAELQTSFPAHKVEIHTGLYGDIAGTLKSLQTNEVDAIAVALEWSDLDARLGIRTLGGWSPRNYADIIAHVETQLAHLQTLIAQRSNNSPVAVSLPTLALPPMFFTASWQSNFAELKLNQLLAQFALTISDSKTVRVVNQRALDFTSPLAERGSIKSELTNGFPYTGAHAYKLAHLLAKLIRNPAPKKGLITDLDNTFWSGIVGDVGVNNVTWDLDNHTQQHGLYQQFLHALADEGILVAIASKNEASVVEDAFKREDLLIPNTKIFPFEVSWNSKARAVERILATWNIAAEAVVFVDDNPIELAEVKTHHPDIECLEFPHTDANAVYDLLIRLRDLFGKNNLSEEDAIRLESLRAQAAMRRDDDDESNDANSAGFSETLLEQAFAHITFNFAKDANDTRAFELVNKTNQFNLNGKRLTESAWRASLQNEDSFLLTANYTDRFGALGKIAVIKGRINNGCIAKHNAARDLHVTSWVMSCRAFARRIEHACLRRLFDKYEVERITFDYVVTARNMPLTNFLKELNSSSLFDFKEQHDAPQIFTLERETFNQICPKLFHRITENS